MVRTRSSSPLTEDEVSMDGTLAEVKKPSSDCSKAVKVVIAPKSAISLPVFRLPSPKNGAPVLYVISEEACFEIVQSGLSHRSWFYGEDVTEDGSIRMYSPVNPLFLALPYFLRTQDKFLELDDILSDSEFPAVEVLKGNKQLLRTLTTIADQKEICDTVVYRYNQEKALAWIRTRLERVKASLLAEETIHKAITEDEEVLNRYCFGILLDYLPDQLADTAKAFLQIKDVVIVEERVEVYKRKVDMQVLVEKPAAKKLKESAKQKQLAQASKGTKSINSFFTKK